MGRSYRRMAAVAVGALIASPALALLSGSTASADDLSYLGPIDVDGYSDSFAYNTSTFGVDNLLTGSSNYVPFDLDAFYGTPASGDSGVLFTIPLIYQGGFEDVGGTFTPISTFDAADFLNPDQGLVDLGGTPPASLGVESIPFTIGGYSDVFSINTSTLGIDNLLEGTSSGLPFDLDIFSGGTDAASYDAVLTIPSLFQVGFEDVAGAITPLFSLNAADFVAPDLGLSLIGGV